MIERSILDPDEKSQMPISQDSYVLAICRKPEGNNNPEHVFLMIEGMVGDDIRLLRFDPVQDRQNPEKITVKVRERIVSQSVALCTLTEELFDGEKVLGRCCEVYRDDVDRLEDVVKQVNRNPQNYNLLGRKALLPKTIAACRTESTVVAGCSMFGQDAREVARAIVKPGDNCFTAIRYLLTEARLDDLNKKLPESKDELIATIPSLRLENKSFSKSATETTQYKCRIL